jgi:hypothetical protein
MDLAVAAHDLAAPVDDHCRVKGVIPCCAAVSWIGLVNGPGTSSNIRVVACVPVTEVLGEAQLRKADDGRPRPGRLVDQT